MIAESERKAMDADIAFVHQGERRESLKKGKLTLGDLYTTLPFGHRVNKIILTGNEIKLALEQQWRKDQENDMLQTVGITYNWDSDAPIGSRISDLKDQFGQNLEPNKHYEVAVSNYLASGGDGFAAFKQGRFIKSGPLVVMAFKQYIKEKYPIEN